MPHGGNTHWQGKLIVFSAAALLVASIAAGVQAQSERVEINGKRYIAFASYGDNLLDPEGKTILPVYLVLGETTTSVWGQMLAWTLADSPLGKRFAWFPHTITSGRLEVRIGGTLDNEGKISFETLMHDPRKFDPERPLETFSYSVFELTGDLSQGGDVIDLKIANDLKIRFYRIPPQDINILGFYFGTTADLDYYFDNDTEHAINTAVAGIIRLPGGEIAMSVACATDELGGYASAYFDQVETVEFEDGMIFTAENADGARFEGELIDGTLRGTATFSPDDVLGAGDRRQAVAEESYDIEVKYFGDKPGRKINARALSERSDIKRGNILNLITLENQYGANFFITGINAGHLVQARFNGRTIPVAWQNITSLNDLTSEFTAENTKIIASQFVHRAKANDGGTLEFTWINPDGSSTTASCTVVPINP